MTRQARVCVCFINDNNDDDDDDDTKTRTYGNPLVHEQKYETCDRTKTNDMVTSNKI
jgi:hypothetical protein